MKILNLYAGIGGNRALWPKSYQVTAIEYSEDIASVYRDLFPRDNVIVTDAHQYLLDHFDEFDIIWSSPPCQSHSRMIRSGRNRTPRYPDLRLYEEILFLQHNFEGPWMVENVIPYYSFLVKPSKIIGRHVFWANFELPEVESPKQPADFINKTNLAGRAALMDWLGIHFDKVLYYEGNNCPAQVLRNAVHPIIGKEIMKIARKNV